MEHLNGTQSSRGFIFMPKLPGAYGGIVSIYESSGAGAPRIWLVIEELDDLNGPKDGPRHDAHVHLEAEDAWKLADQLRWLVENHYQGDARPDWAVTEATP